jgi:hypothetical protein
LPTSQLQHRLQQTKSPKAPHRPPHESSSKHMSFLRTITPLKPFLTTRAFATTARTMAPKQEWLVILPDYTGKLAERNQVRAYVLHPSKHTSTLLGRSHKHKQADSRFLLDTVTTSSTPDPMSNPASSFSAARCSRNRSKRAWHLR